MLSYTYRIAGEPLVHIKGQEGKQRSWTTYKQNKIIYFVTLESQHDERPMLEGPLKAELHFYQKEGWGKNDLSSYIRFIEHILADITYKSYQNITHITASRSKVKKDPHTLIVISEREAQ